MTNSLPTISVVTPSYNQGGFLEDAIRSVLDQDYAGIEYVIMDGNSSDNSPAVIQKYAQDERLIYWVSEPDGGQYDAINKGFAQTSGEIMAWINSDDKYMPWAFSVVGEIFRQYPQIEWLTSSQHAHFNERGQLILCRYVGGFNKKAFFRGNNLPGDWFSRAVIQQEATFWRRSLWERAGGQVNAGLAYAGDFDLWARFFRRAELYAVDIPLAGIRKHAGQKTMRNRQKNLSEAAGILLGRGGQPYGVFESKLRQWLWYMLGYRSYRQLPRLIGAGLARLGIFYPVPVCTWQNGQWIITTDYTV